MDLYSSSNKLRKDFKKGISADDNRRRREEVTFRLRKEKKEEGLAKRRNMQSSSNSFSSAEASTDGQQTAESTPQQIAAETGPLDALIQGLHTNNMEEIVKCMRGIRKQLSVEKNPPVMEVISKGVLPIMVAALQRHDCTELQFEAAWALTNVASTESTRAVVECGAVPHLVQLLNSGVPDIREQCAWCLGNIAGDSSELRDGVLACNPMPGILANIAQPASLSLLRNSVWTLSNLCRGKPAPAPQTIAAALPVLAQLLRECTDADVCADAAWALSYLSDGDEARVQSVVDLQISHRLTQMLTQTGSPLQVPALRILGNFASGSSAQTQAALDAGLLTAALPLLRPEVRRGLRKETCWVLSNVAAGSPEQLQMFLQHSDLVMTVLQQLGPSVEWDVRKEAVWVLSNIATSAKRDSLLRLIEMGVMQSIAGLLEVGETKVILLALESLEVFLKIGQTLSDPEMVVSVFTDCGGAENLEKLQEHSNQEVYKRAVKLIEHFFSTEEEEEEADGENQAPAGNVFQFSFPAASDLQKQPQQQTFAFGGAAQSQVVPQGTHTRFVF